MSGPAIVAASIVLGQVMKGMEGYKKDKERAKKRKEKKDKKAQKKAEKARSKKASEEGMKAHLKMRQKEATKSPEFQAKLKKIREELKDDK